MKDVSKTKEQLIDELQEMRRRLAEFDGQATKGKRAREKPKYIRDVAFLSRTAMGFLELSPEQDIYEFIGRRLKELVGNSIVIVNSFEAASDSVRVHTVLGIGKKLGAVIRILGRHPVGMSLTIDDEARLGLGSGKLVKIPGHLYEFCFRRIPRTVCCTIEKLLGLGDIYAMGFTWKGKLFGSACILTRKRNVLVNQSLIETFIYQASVGLQHRYAEQTLQQAYDELEIRVEERARELAKANEQLHAEITERKQTGEALHQSEEKLRTILENTNDVIFQLSPLGKILYVSPSSVELYGYKSGDLIGRHLKKTTPISELPKALKALKSVLSGKTIRHFEINQMDANGNIIPVEINAVPVRKEGKIIAAEGIMRDITERKRAREQERAVEALREMNHMKGDLLSNVSHELRTPLATIKGYSTMILDYDRRLKRDEKRQYLESIDGATDRLSELVDNLLDMSGLDAGLMTLERRPTSVSMLIKETVEDACLRTPERQIVFVQSERLPRLSIDARRIRQVLDNLIDNAIRYSREGTKVMVSARRVRDGLLMSVADQGMGIPAEELPKIFDRMYRVQRENARDEGGAGLGLAICRGLVEKHGGRIWAESEEGKGSAFLFTLPLHTRGGNSSGQRP